jgi:exopolysaccharide production protein ExoQ
MPGYSAVSMRSDIAPAGDLTVARLAHALLAAAFLFYVFVGTNPFPSVSLAARVDGNPVDRLYVLGLGGLGALVLLLNYRALPSILLQGAGLWIVAGVAVLSIVWSAYPDLTLRRSIVLVCLTVAAAGVAAGIRDLHRAHTVFAYSMGATMALNLAAVILVPSEAMSDIGAEGWYSQKNAAGAVAMTALLAQCTWLVSGRKSAGHWMIGFAMIAISLAFLLLTRSKTSLALTALALLVLASFSIAARGGPVVTLAGALLAIVASSCFLVLLTLNDFDLSRILGLVLEDTSFTGRDELWAFAVRVGMENPWLGHGYGAFWDVGVGGDPLLRMEPGSWLGDVEPGVINQAHNGYLELWLHLGIPLMVFAVLVVLVLAAKGVLFCVIARNDPGVKAALAFLTIMPFIYLAHNLTEASLFMRGLFMNNIITLVLFVLARIHELTRPREPMANSTR